MKKNKGWLVAANSSIAHIYFIENKDTLSEIKVLEHPESRLHNLDLVSDKPGRDFESVGVVRHAVGKSVTPKVHEFSVFAREVAEFLKTAHNQGEFDHLYIAASPNFLGLIREVLDPNIAKLIESDINKDITHINPMEIPGTLPFILK